VPLGGPCTLERPAPRRPAAAGGPHPSPAHRGPSAHLAAHPRGLMFLEVSGRRGYTYVREKKRRGVRIMFG
jgi:hypothetical protein